MEMPSFIVLKWVPKYQNTDFICLEGLGEKRSDDTLGENTVVHREKHDDIMKPCGTEAIIFGGK